MAKAPQPRKAEEAGAAEQRRRELKAKFARVSRQAWRGRLSAPPAGSTRSGNAGRTGLSAMEIGIVIGIAVFVVLMAMRIF